MRNFVEDAQIIVTEFILADPNLHSAIPSLKWTSFACQQTILKWYIQQKPLDITRPPPETMWWLLSLPKLTKTIACARSLGSVHSAFLEHLENITTAEFINTMNNTQHIFKFLIKHSNMYINLSSLTLSNYTCPPTLSLFNDLHSISQICPILEHLSITDSNAALSTTCSSACYSITPFQETWMDVLYNDTDKQCAAQSLKLLPDICAKLTKLKSLTLACFLPLDCSSSEDFPATLGCLLKREDHAHHYYFNHRLLVFCEYHLTVTHRGECFYCRHLYAQTLLAAQLTLVQAIGDAVPILDSLTILSLFYGHWQTRQLRYRKFNKTWEVVTNPWNPEGQDCEPEDADTEG